MEIGLNKKINGFSNFYPMKIYEKSAVNTSLPCTITNIDIMQDYEIPTEAIESNELISDNIYRQPFNLNVEVYVNNDDLSEFERSLKSIQYSNNGFIIIDQNNQKYSDIYLMGFTKQTEINDGWRYSLSFTEIIKVQGTAKSYNSGARSNLAANNSVNNAGASSRVNNGEQTTSKSILKSLGGLI